MAHMTYKIRNIDHIGIVVHDFDEAKAFFEDFGFITRGEQFEESELLDKVVGVKGAKSRIAFMEAPNAQINIELTEFIYPETPTLPEANHIYTQGIQHICLAVVDLDGIVSSVEQKGWELITDVINYQDIYKLCYFRGPAGVILELAEKL
jgi:catechol 2,3-dioxygenase-like lactoylglutathione lyase family enzyme